MTQDSLAVSLWQHAPLGAGKAVPIDSALEQLAAAVVAAKAAGSSLLITPECSLTGYDIDEQQASIAAFAKADAAVEGVKLLAREHGMAILFGFMETDGPVRYNAVQLIDAKGESVLHYRKTHLWGELDRRLFSAGDVLGPVVDLAGWRIAALICYDVEFPEAVRRLAIAGAELVVVPTALMKPFGFVASHLVPVRAAESQVWIAYANQVGAENDTVYQGCSCVVGPDGTVMARAPDDQPMLLHVELRRDALDSIRAQVPYLEDRRPELYR